MMNTNPGDDTAWRSKKYIKLSDEDIIHISQQSLPRKDKLYLLQEIDHRNLADAVDQAKKSALKTKMFGKVWWRYVPILIGIIFVTKRMLGSF